MDVDKLFEYFGLFNSSGFTFNIEQLSLLHNSLCLLQNENHFEKIYFWGRIFGSEGDYYIAYGFKEDVLRDKKYFYSINLFQWVMLPRAKKELFGIQQISYYFTGDPASKISITNKLTDENYEKLAGLTEEKYLAYVLSTIKQESEIMPRGFLLKSPNCGIIHNKYYKGLSFHDSQNLASYVHYRRPKSKWNTNLLTRDDFNYAVDFLDTIDRDIPKGHWSLHTDNDKKTVCLQSLLWPGTFFYAKINSGEFCWFYIGDGIRNMDLPFYF